MILLRKLLFPFAVFYGWITWFRNLLYDAGIFKSDSFDLPVIAVGNLSVGGTGKTPMIEYLIRLLSEKYEIATLSRGYKRQSEGFVLADVNATAAVLGDEPFQFHQKFPNIAVAVDANRKNGIEKLISLKKPDIILLDDAFQHRKVKAGFYILLTAYGDLFSDDFMLPTGNLREARSGVKRANIVIVTKCPPTISEAEQQQIKQKLQTRQPVYFTSIAYDDFIYSEDTKRAVSEITPSEKILVAGIAKPEPFFSYLKSKADATLTFPDHHHFTEKDIRTISEKARGRAIITTEKDYVRLKGQFRASQLFYLPIKTSFISDNNNFDNTILNYVGKSSANR